MKFDLVRPCDNCPFRTDVPPYLRRGRAREIVRALLSDQTFACHKTTKCVEDENGDEQRVVVSSSQHCAGSMIILERMNRPNQLMRIFERLRAYDHRRLDMDAPVFATFADFVKAQAR